MPDENGEPTPEEVAEAVAAAALLEKLEREAAARRQAELN